MDRFSKREGYAGREVEIVVREDAPQAFRDFIIQTLYDLRWTPTEIRKVICRTLRISPDDTNWSDYPNIDNEIRCLISDCDWFRVYDIVEALYNSNLRNTQLGFAKEINDYFLENGIGWKLDDGQILFRGDNSFENILKKAQSNIAQSGFDTAKNEISEAISDLSRKPNPDRTGAIQHSLACLECITREIVGNKTQTLGQLIRHNRQIVPPPIDIVVEKIWGFSSNQGRHLQENKEPNYDETELLVGLAASISSYLARKKWEI
jgi:hypothetical protein